jgi:hypothetical protein
VITYTTAGSWPSTLRLPGLTTHKPPAYKNLAHQPIKHNYNSFQNMVYNGARPWGHYNPPPLIFALSSVQLYTASASFSKFFKKMRVLCPHNICMLPCHVLRTVPGPLDPYKLHSSIPELFYFPVQYAHRMHLQDTFWFHLNHIPIDYMISIRYIYFLSNEI